MSLTKAKAIQLIHIAKQQLRMDEISYWLLLKELTGKQSTTKMTRPELICVLDAMQKKGFKITPPLRLSPATENAKVKSRIAHKIRATWINMAKSGMVRDGSEKALNAWVRGVVNPIYAKSGKNIQVLNVGALDDKMATIVLERLKKWQARGVV